MTEEPQTSTSKVSSKDILKEFLLESKSFYHLVSRKQFHYILKSKLKKSLNPKLEDDLYELLLSQKRSKSTSKVENNINNLRLQQEYDPNNEGNVDMSDESLNLLINSVSKLNDSIENEVVQLEKAAAEELTQINEMVDSLNDLKYGSINFDSSIENLKDELQKFEQKLLR